METLVEIIGTILIAVLQEIWPPILAILDGVLVLCFGFLTWLFFTEGEPAKAVISLLAAVLFLAVGITGFKAGLYQRRNRSDRRKNHREY